MSRTKTLPGLVASLAILGIAVGGASAITIEELNSTRSGGNGNLSSGNYGALRADLANPANFGPGGTNPNTVTLLPDIATVTAASLVGVDVFVLFEVGTLSASEALALSNFVSSGGRVIISTDSGGDGAGAANALLSLTGANSVVSAAVGFQDLGNITGTGLSSNGLFGNLVGGTFGVSLGNILTVGANSVLIGLNDGNNFIMETNFGSGHILTTADVSFVDLFVSAGSSFNPNNAALFENFLPSLGGPVEPGPGGPGPGGAVPGPSTLVFLGSGLAALTGAAAWRRRHSH
jgi:hypothetical protein